MSYRFLAASHALAILSVVVWLAPVPVAAQAVTAAADDSTAPRTSWGDPDLQGVWNHGTVTPLERPKEYAGREFLTDEEVAAANESAKTFASSERRADLSPERDVGLAYNQFWWDRGSSDGRTALIVDPSNGKLPAVTPEAQERMDARRAGFQRRRADGPEDRNLWERCLTLGVPRLGGAYNNNFQLFQTPGHVAILHEMVHETRIVPLDGRPHLGNGVQQWIGDSRGRWEGDTLVVDTTNFTDKTSFRGSTSAMHLVERFTRVDAETLLYEVTVDDPATWTRTWTAALAMPRTEGGIFEYACHEGNYGIANLLTGARTQEKASEEAGERR